jgi:hypothetical protein
MSLTYPIDISKSIMLSETVKCCHITFYILFKKILIMISRFQLPKSSNSKEGVEVTICGDVLLYCSRIIESTDCLASCSTFNSYGPLFGMA